MVNNKMNLKKIILEKIRIQNFLSFADAEISFKNNSLNVISGENGVGKTNFCRAINWCLYQENDCLEEYAYKNKTYFNNYILAKSQSGNAIIMSVEILLKINNSKIMLRRVISGIKENNSFHEYKETLDIFYNTKKRVKHVASNKEQYIKYIDELLYKDDNNIFNISVHKLCVCISGSMVSKILDIVDCKDDDKILTNELKKLVRPLFNNFKCEKLSKAKYYLAYGEKTILGLALLLIYYKGKRNTLPLVFDSLFNILDDEKTQLILKRISRLKKQIILIEHPRALRGIIRDYELILDKNGNSVFVPFIKKY